MIQETTILIERTLCGYYVRWFYNGFHYWNFRSERESLLTEGEKYNTTGKTKVRLYSGQLTTNEIAGLWPIIRAKDVAVYISGVWKTLIIEPGSSVTHRNDIAGYDFEVTATIGGLQVPLVIPEPPVIYTTPPAFMWAEVGNVASNMLVIRFNHVLQLVTPANGDFTPSFTGGAVSVTNVEIVDLGGYYYVYLTLSRVIVFGQTGTIQYTPGVNKLIGVAPYNAFVYSFTEAVTNNVADLVPPAFVSAEVDIIGWPDGNFITVTIDKDQNTAIVPFLPSYTITGFSGGAVGAVDVTLALRYIYIELDRNIAAGETGGYVTYNPAGAPAERKLEGTNGVDLTLFDESVYNRP